GGPHVRRCRSGSDGRLLRDVPVRRGEGERGAGRDGKVGVAAGGDGDRHVGGRRRGEGDTHRGGGALRDRQDGRVDDDRRTLDGDRDRVRGDGLVQVVLRHRRDRVVAGGDAGPLDRPRA